MAFMTFHIVGNVIIPTEFHFFQRGRYTTNQIRYVYKWVIYHYVQRSKATLVGHDPLLKWVYNISLRSALKSYVSGA